MKKLSVKDGNYILTKRDLKNLYLYVYEIGRQNGVLMEGAGGLDKVQDNVNQFMEFQSIPKRIIHKQSYVDNCPFFYDDDFQQEWKDYSEVRRKKKASTSERAICIVLKEMMSLSNGKKETAIEIIKQSHLSGWSKVYKLKTPINDKGTKQSREDVWRDRYQQET